MTIPKARRVTTTGRITATAIRSAGSPASDLTPVASIGLLGPTISIALLGSRIAALFTAERVSVAQPGSTVSAWASDMRVASAGGRRLVHDRMCGEPELAAENSTLAEAGF